MSKYVVTGGAGFIGSTLTDKLISDGHEVIVIDNLCTGVEVNINNQATFFNADISQLSPRDELYDHAVNMFTGVDTVFHFAARARVQPSIIDPHYYNLVNITGTLNILDLAKQCNVRRMVFSSSSSIYGNVTESNLPTTEKAPVNPLSPYGLQKLCGEQYCKLYSTIHDIETVCLRYFSVYGLRQPTSGAYSLVMGIFADQRLNGLPLRIFGDGEQRRDFTFVDDVVTANIKAGKSLNVGAGEVINIGNGDNRSVNDIAGYIGGEREYLDPVIEPRETLANNTLARKLLNWSPTMRVEDWIPGYKKILGI